MSKQARWLLVTILILALASLACSTLLGDDAEPSDSTTVVEPTAEAPDSGDAPAQPTQEVPTDDGGGDGAPTAVPPAPTEPPTDPSSSDSGAAGSIDLSDSSLFSEPEGFGSFHINMVIEFEEQGADAASQSGSIVIDGTRVSDPPGLSLTFTVEGDDELASADGFSIVEVDGTTYMTLPDGSCFATDPADMMTDSFTDLMEVQDFLGNEAQLLESGVTVNGVVADLYALDSSNLDQFGSFDGAVTEIEEATVAIARDGGYVTQVIISGSGQGSLLGDSEAGEGTIYYEFNLVPIDGVVDIPVPDDCFGGSETESEYPILDDAYEVTSFAGIFTYLTGRSVAEAKDFYSAEMAVAGWAVDSELVIEDLVSIQFSKDGQTISLTITPEEDSGATSVLIISE